MLSPKEKKEMGRLEDLTDHRIETERRQSEKWRIPKQVIIETSAACQLNCVGCPINRDSNAGSFMPLEDVISILDRIDFTTTIIPWMNGEPLLHRDYEEILRQITERNMRTYITTNGMVWHQDIMELMVAKNSIYQVIFSLDGCTPGIQKKVRPGSDEPRILETIHRFGQLKMEAGNNIDMAVKICRRGQDQAEVERYIANWLQADFIDFVVEGKLLDNDNAPKVRTSPCTYPDLRFMVIRANGQMVPCAYNHRVVNENYFEWPNVFDDREKPIIEYYNDPVVLKWREDQRRGFFLGPCETCGFAYNGEGFEGMIAFRDPNLRALFPWPIYWHSDYYNQFYSLTRKWDEVKLSGDSNDER
jgi:MoaA/NifB/PqqE/SkfB family radical SAM enzyme